MTGRLGPAELRELFLFEHLDDTQLDWLAGHGWVEDAEAGTAVLAEGAPAERLAVLLSGTLRLCQRVGRDEVEVVRTDQAGVYAGATRAYLPEGDTQYTATVWAVTGCRFWFLSSADFSEFMHRWFPMAIHLLEGLFLGMRANQAVVAQRQQLLALGALSAGLTHELNNPAAAAVRAADALRGRVAGTRRKLAMLAHDQIDPRLLMLLVDVQEEAVQRIAAAPKLSAVAEAEREDELTDWLEDHEVGEAWELAPIFTGAGTTTDFLDRLAESAPPGLLEGAVRWLAYTLEAELLLGEITESVTRISSLVGAARQYSHLDRTPYERVDVHEGLESTLVMLGAKLEGVRVVTEFDRSLPPVPVFAGELHQVWTNLIDNAVQAMGGSGTLTLRTAPDGDHARIEVRDTGPGVPPELRGRIFEPFFTTKPVGQGTGLGLDISYRIVVGRHGGDLNVESEPGDTRFIVRLPLRDRPSSEGAAEDRGEAAGSAP
ncbi:ATP-binding protein [Actinocorallia populi]|uniref:ATP-binding protein n=1 Tax=Actinocorallia populi TaxID=2079200 RepID=UPI000D09600E|nr:ATP-binding protein [Actinocorallia populi]